MTDVGGYRDGGRWTGGAADMVRAAGCGGPMASQIQQIVTQSGEVMVVLPLAHFQFLSAVAHPHPAATPSCRDTWTEPAAIRQAIASGESPVAAWRKHRGLTQNALARLAGVSRFTVMRIETAGAGAGNRNTRRCLASALDIPFDRI